jgi:hypothetical protein
MEEALNQTHYFQVVVAIPTWVILPLNSITKYVFPALKIEFLLECFT